MSLDSSVSPVPNPAIVITPAAYLLFYRRRNAKPLGGPLLEKILGGSKSAHLKEESGNGGADNANDSGISDNSPSSSPRLRGGIIGAADSSDNSRSSSPLVSGQHGSSTRYQSFGGAGSSTNIFDTATPSGVPPSPQGSNSSSGPPSYDVAIGDRLFGPVLPQMDRDDLYDPPKAVGFAFGGGLSTNGAPTTPTSTTGDMGDSDKDADGEDDVDMLADVDIVATGRKSFPEVAEDSVTEYMIGADEGLGAGVDDDCNREVHDVELSPETEEEKVMDINA